MILFVNIYKKTLFKQPTLSFVTPTYYFLKRHFILKKSD